jgi:hypothetical protein
VITTAANFQLDEVDRAMADLEARSKRLAPAFRQLRRPLRRDQKAHARAESGPDGQWPKRSPLTEARREAHNRRARAFRAIAKYSPRQKGDKARKRSLPARILGRLPNAIQVVVGELYVRASSRATFGGAQQHGDRVGHGHRVLLPSRPFLWLSDALLNTAADVLGSYVVKGWQR